VPVEQRSDYLTWSAEDRATVVHLGSSVVERLNRDIKKGLGATRRRGTELGGILLGHVEPGGGKGVWVDDYQLVPCEYAFGPSYVLSTADEAAFGEAFTSWSPKPGAATYAVGYFRSHTRDGLGLAPPDAELFSRYFGFFKAIALIVKPFATRDSVASFFVPVLGKLDPATPADEFTFGPAPGSEHETVEAVTPEPVRPEPPAPEPARKEPPAPEQPPAKVTPYKPAHPAPPAPPAVSQPFAPVVPPTANSRPTVSGAPQPSPEAQRILSNVLGAPGDLETRGRRRWDRPMFSDVAEPPSAWLRLLSWTLFLLAVLTFGGLAGYQYAGGKIPGLSPPPAASPPDAYSMGLAVERQGADLLVTWNRNSEAVQRAEGALLIITEPPGRKEVKLGFSELRNGIVMYKHLAPEVIFRFELALGGDRQLIDSITWRQGGQAPTP
jgi:hypothetical protein